MTDSAMVVGGGVVAREVAAPVSSVLRGVEDGSSSGHAAERRPRLVLLGSWALWSGGERLPVTSSAQRLLVLLALKGRQRRGYVAGMLWPEVRDEQALTRLRCTLWRLRHQCPSLLETRQQTLALNDSVTVDVEALVTIAHAVVEGRIEPGQLAGSFATLIDAPELLLGWYDDWVLQERDRINQLRVRALEVLVDDLLRDGRRSEAFEAASAAVHLDPLRESTHRAVMRVNLAEGNPALARRELERYRALLRMELGTEELTSEMGDMLSRRP